MQTNKPAFGGLGVGTDNELNRVSSTQNSLTSFPVKNISQSQLTAAANAAEHGLTASQFDAQKEVEIRAQNENSQLFQDSIMQSHMGAQNRPIGGQSYGHGMSGVGASIMGGMQSQFD